MTIKRLGHGPIIYPELDASIGTNINGPSLIRVPDWLPDRFGTYYLYFGHHQGKYIRLAYADRLEGPWTIYKPGTLQLKETPCHGHIASPDVHIDNANQRIIMYYHGPILDKATAAQTRLTQRYPMFGGQRTLVSSSEDGIHFKSDNEILGSSYWRVFTWNNVTYGLGMPGIFYRSSTWTADFGEGPTLFTEHMRHAAVYLRHNTLYVFFTNAGDCPEHMLASHIHLTDDWQMWTASEPESVLFPEQDYEGGDLPLEPSKRSAVHHRARQLRDPGVFKDGDRLFLLYAIAGEHGIALAEILW